MLGEHKRGPLVVGIDGSANARRALQLAGELAEALGVGVVVVHAIGLTAVLEGRRVAADSHRAEIAAAVSTWSQALRDVGVETWEERLLDGPAVDVVLRTALDVDTTMIVLGTRGVGGHDALLLGSTSHQVIEHSEYPVLVVPPVGKSAVVHPDDAG